MRSSVTSSGASQPFRQLGHTFRANDAVAVREPHVIRCPRWQFNCTRKFAVRSRAASVETISFAPVRISRSVSEMLRAAIRFPL